MWQNKTITSCIPGKQKGRKKRMREGGEGKDGYEDVFHAC